MLRSYGVNADKKAAWAKNFTKKHSKLYPHYLLDYEEPWAAISQLIVSKINRARSTNVHARGKSFISVKAHAMGFSWAQRVWPPVFILEKN